MQSGWQQVPDIWCHETKGAFPNRLHVMAGYLKQLLTRGTECTGCVIHMYRAQKKDMEGVVKMAIKQSC